MSRVSALPSGIFEGSPDPTIMLQKLCASMVVMLAAAAAEGQNLVPNSGFETYSALPSGYAQLCKATGWTSASNACTLTPGCGHPDYMHTLGGPGVQAPNTTFGTTMPHTGSGMIGFATWYLSGVTNFREYPRIMLTTPLVAGQSYVVSFWTTNGINPYSGWAANNLGVVFTMAPVTQTCGAPITGVAPQIEITTIVYSTSWQLHTFTFIPAQAFQYMTIGNFHNDAATSASQMTATGSMGAYYFMDDVSVTPNMPLPVELLSFVATCETGHALLRWTTATETNSDHFNIERGASGPEWEVIGTVGAAGTSQQAVQYGFRDPDASDGTWYYRLTLVDHDGASAVSPVVVLQGCGEGAVAGQWLLDVQGRTCGPWPPPQGSLATGVYLLRTQFTDGTIRTGKIIVQ